MSLRDWHALSLTRRGHQVHLRTDPACVIHEPPKPGSRLDMASRGATCWRCLEARSVLSDSGDPAGSSSSSGSGVTTQ